MSDFKFVVTLNPHPIIIWSFITSHDSLHVVLEVFIGLGSPVVVDLDDQLVHEFLSLFFGGAFAGKEECIFQFNNGLFLAFEAT